MLEMTQAICLYRKQTRSAGTLFLGIDTHGFTTKVTDACFIDVEHLARMMRQWMTSS
jgi:phosphoglucomutase